MSVIFGRKDISNAKVKPLHPGPGRLVRRVSERRGPQLLPIKESKKERTFRENKMEGEEEKEDKMTLEEENREWEIRSYNSNGSSASSKASSHSQSKSNKSSNVSSHSQSNSSSHSSGIHLGESPNDVKAAKGGNEEIGIHSYKGSAEQVLLAKGHRKFWNTKLKSVDKMLFSTDSAETPMIINTVFLVDGVIDVAKLRIFLRSLSDSHPRMRMCIDEHGRWQPADLDFDVICRYHRIPEGQNLDRYIEKKKLLANRIDTTEHLWEWHVFLTNEGKHAFLVRLHHVIGDGLALVKLVVNSFDKVGPPKSPSSPTPITSAGSDVTNSPEDRVKSEVARTAAVGSSRRRKGNIFTKVFRALVVMLYSTVFFIPVTIGILLMRSDPDNLFRSKQRHISKSMTFLNPCKTADLKAIGLFFKGSINDVLSAILAGAMRSYHLKLSPQGTKLKDMTVVIPISTRSTKERGVVLDNQVASVFLRLPVSEKSLRRRFMKTKRNMDRLKFGPKLPVMIILIKFFLSVLPSWMLKRIQESYISKTTMIFSNVPGPREKMYMQGVRVDHLFGFVPLVGNQQAGFVAFTYGGDLMVSLLTNKKSIRHPKLFMDCFQAELEVYQQFSQEINVKSPTPKVPSREIVYRDSIALGHEGEVDGEFRGGEFRGKEMRVEGV